MQSSSSGISSLVSLAALITIVILIRRGKRNTPETPLLPGERFRPLAITMLDPVVSLMIIGPIFWHLITTNFAHVGAAFLGGTFGVGIAWARARVMYVRAEPKSKSVVLRRSGIEYGLLFLLIVIRMIETSETHNRSGFSSLVLTALISLGVVETIARSGFIVLKYQKNRDTMSNLIPEDYDRTDDNVAGA